MFTFHVFFLGIATACLYALLQTKQKTYKRFLDALETFTQTVSPIKFGYILKLLQLMLSKNTIQLQCYRAAISI